VRLTADDLGLVSDLRTHLADRRDADVAAYYLGCVLGFFELRADDPGAGYREQKHVLD
jgi:hypothetical protein